MEIAVFLAASRWRCIACLNFLYSPKGPARPGGGAPRAAPATTALCRIRIPKWGLQNAKTQGYSLYIIVSRPESGPRTAGRAPGAGLWVQRPACGSGLCGAGSSQHPFATVSTVYCYTVRLFPVRLEVPMYGGHLRPVACTRPPPMWQLAPPARCSALCWCRARRAVRHGRPRTALRRRSRGGGRGLNMCFCASLYRTYYLHLLCYCVMLIIYVHDIFEAPQTQARISRVHSLWWP